MTTMSWSSRSRTSPSDTATSWPSTPRPARRRAVGSRRGAGHARCAARACVGELADACAVYLRDDAGSIHRVAGAHPDDSRGLRRRELADDLSEKVPRGPGDRDRRDRLRPGRHRRGWPGMCGWARRRAWCRAGVRSAIVTPIPGPADPIGALTLAMVRPPPRSRPATSTWPSGSPSGSRPGSRSARPTTAPAPAAVGGGAVGGHVAGETRPPPCGSVPRRPRGHAALVTIDASRPPARSAATGPCARSRPPT